MSHDVFICHSSVDRVIANAVCARLEQNKIRCWIAPRDVIPGREFAASIIEAIHGSKLTILVFSANSNDSQHVHKEIERSVNAGIPILPFRVEDVTPSPALEYFISDAHWLDALSPPLEEHLDHLVGTVQLLLNRGTPGDEATLAPVAPGRVTPEPPPRRSRIALWVGLGAALVAIVVLAVVLLTRTGGGPSDTAGAAPPPSTTSQAASQPFTDEFTGSVDKSWTWVNEKPEAWKVTAQGTLEIVGQQPPPFRNVLVRTAPTGSYSVKLNLTFPTKGKGFTGLVLTGKDPDTRLQFGWTETALVTQTFTNGDIADDSEMMTADLPVKPGGDAQLLLEVRAGLYITSIYDPKYDTWYDMGTGHLDPGFTRLGLLVYSKTGAVTGTFDRFEIFF
ncbi:toll/interleukin-1 receptor domain-containing protein [Humibacillus xanthopallidus]|uniref:TIR domain-containing protein n=1 Tax=Humibacillus xanthopallidus TaxID=412689 RepID=A0A543I0Y4_9MICO|nr:toll/interleukin-1 receptor domain-containing protein [Humibacillus xanthopallidus]TQM64257.1 TIR domain-containing protein [Humibacillus xanthopallidus]